MTDRDELNSISFQIIAAVGSARSLYLEAVRAAQANGHRVFLCTGRNYRMTSPVLRYGFDGYVCSAGG